MQADQEFRTSRTPRPFSGARACEEMVGCSTAYHEMVAEIRSLARCDATVLIEGETGTGKELCSRAIHRSSPRARHAFCPVNCGALPRELVENELFGHRRAAFTGASVAQTGLVHQAEGGTLFLDEVDSLSASAQAALLRFVQHHEYRPLGSAKVVRANVRLLVATNIDLESAAAAGSFRRDLYYRLDVLRLRVPPLRERLEDIPLLARHFLAKYADKFHGQAQGFSRKASEVLLKYHWPGNVRELEHVVERAVALGLHCEVLTPDHLRLGGKSKPLCQESFCEAKQRVVQRFERSYLTAYLAAYKGNIAQAASAAKKNRRAFWQLMQKHSIDAEAFRPASA